MGCDLHIYLEYQPFPGTIRPAWESLATDVRVSRDYDLFAIVAGVRNGRGLTPISPPRGLPTQLSWPTQRAWEEDPGHDASYLTYQEVETVQHVYAGLEGRRAEVMWVSRDLPAPTGWTLYEREDAVPYWVRVPPPPAGSTSPDTLAVALRVTSGPYGANLEVAAILAFLSVYERAGLPTRMVFWFDN